MSQRRSTAQVRVQPARVERPAAPAPTPWFERWSAGFIMAAVLAVNQGLMLMVFPSLPNNDSVSYIEFGHMSDAKRPVDHYQPPDHIPSVAEIPKVEAWRRHAYPSYGYPWMFLDLPADWETNWSWVTAGIKPPLAVDRLVPTNHEWDNAFPMGASLYFDALMVLFPAASRAFMFVLLNHVFVIVVSLLVWRTAMEMSWAGVGWWAGLAYGLAFGPGARAQELMTEPLFIVFDMAALYLIVRGCRRDSWVPLAAGGVALGGAFAVRAVAVMQPAVVALAILLMSRSWSEWFAKSAICLAPFVAVCVLVLLHNWIFYGRFTYSTAFGRHLFNRVATVDRNLQKDDPSTKLILDLAARPRSGGTEMHPYQSSRLNVYTNSSCWSLFWMLRWQGLTATQADGYLGRAAMAAIRSDPLGYVWRGLGNIITMGRYSFTPFLVQVSEPQAYAQYLTRWFVPQFRLSPYNWVAAQWRVFKEEIPLYGPPPYFNASQRRTLIGIWDGLPRVLGVGFYLAMLGVGVAAWQSRRTWWLLVAGWYLSLLLVPALLQAPNTRYAEPALPAGLLLAGYAAVCTWLFVAARFGLRTQGR